MAGPDGQAFKARQVTFQTQLLGETPNELTTQERLKAYRQRRRAAAKARA